MRIGICHVPEKIRERISEITGKWDRVEKKECAGFFNKKARPFKKKAGLLFFGSPARTRTADPVVNSHLLCRLSYWGSVFERIAYLIGNGSKVKR